MVKREKMNRKHEICPTKTRLPTITRLTEFLGGMLAPIKWLNQPMNPPDHLFSLRLAILHFLSSGRHLYTMSTGSSSFSAPDDSHQPNTTFAPPAAYSSTSFAGMANAPLLQNANRAASPTKTRPLDLRVSPPLTSTSISADAFRPKKKLRGDIILDGLWFLLIWIRMEIPTFSPRMQYATSSLN